MQPPSSWRSTDVHGSAWQHILVPAGCQPKAHMGFWRTRGDARNLCKECPCLYLESFCLVHPLLTEDFTQRPSGGGRNSARELLSPHTLAHAFTYPSLHTHIIQQRHTPLRHVRTFLHIIIGAVVWLYSTVCFAVQHLNRHNFYQFSSSSPIIIIIPALVDIPAD